ncbi:L-serine ammonia-lyase, iron-sulfur-dependent subunit beta [Dehalobacter sp. DCM]|uniref:L-serine ammonia-lyase, iron-sulfur-dependent subunit beta n=1 Tax=Dehalobacter sp. DCM TaxID=2907827 RepID=UPI003081B24F|nr:L-serine ammonia-lyase, iron-sulfur-dependent subunit beta [Dehalobacter sp. DCM]
MKVNSVFDLLGPVMVGPSSSHTAGAVRLANMAAQILGKRVKQAKILLHGSFAETGQGHGTHLALIAGLMGMYPDDERIRQAPYLAEQEGITVIFESAHLGDVHPNTARFYLTDVDGSEAVVTGASLGGGKIRITEVNSFEVEFSGEYPALIVIYADHPGMVADITRQLAVQGINIAQMRVTREGKGQDALAVIETDEKISDDLVREIEKMPMITKTMAVDRLG